MSGLLLGETTSFTNVSFVGLKQPATVPGKCHQPATIHLAVQRGVTPKKNFKIIPKTFRETPTSSITGPGLSKCHHRPWEFGLAILTFLSEKAAQRRQVTYPKFQSRRVLGLEMWKQVAERLSSSFSMGGFQAVFCQASTCFEGSANL